MLSCDLADPYHQVLSTRVEMFILIVLLTRTRHPQVSSGFFRLVVSSAATLHFVYTNRRGNFDYHNFGLTSIYCPLYYLLKSLVKTWLGVSTNKGIKDIYERKIRDKDWNAPGCEVK